MDDPYSYKIESGIAWIVIHGDQDFARMEDVQKRLAADPAFRPDIPKLIDGRRITSWMSVKDIAAIRDLTNPFHAGIKKPRRVAMVSTDVMVSKITKISQDLFAHGPQSGLVEHKYFSNVEAAVAWLKSAPATK